MRKEKSRMGEEKQESAAKKSRTGGKILHADAKKRTHTSEAIAEKNPPKKSVIRHLTEANILVFLFILIAICAFLWAFGLWPSIFRFFF